MTGMIGQIILRLVIWFLLTANFTPANIIIGVAIALLLPMSLSREKALIDRLRDWLEVLFKLVISLPQAYLEAIEMILRPHRFEKVVMQRVNARRSYGLIFLDIFLITFTPKTIVVKFHERGVYEVHHVVVRRPES